MPFEGGFDLGFSAGATLEGEPILASSSPVPSTQVDPVTGAPARWKDLATGEEREPVAADGRLRARRAAARKAGSTYAPEFLGLLEARFCETVSGTLPLARDRSKCKRRCILQDPVTSPLGLALSPGCAGEVMGDVRAASGRREAAQGAVEAVGAGGERERGGPGGGAQEGRQQ